MLQLLCVWLLLIDESEDSPVNSEGTRLGTKVRTTADCAHNTDNPPSQKV